MAVRTRTSTSRIDWTGMPDLSGGNWSVSAWLRRSNGGAANNIFFTTGALVGVSLYLSSTGAEPRIIADLSTTDKQTRETGGFLNRAWEHYVFANADYTATTGASLRIYRNGKLLTIGTTNGAGTAVAWNSTWRMFNSSTNTNWCDADIAAFGVYDRLLDEGEIQELADGALPQSIARGLRFLPDLNGSLYDVVNNVSGVVSGTADLVEDPPLLQDRRTARIYSFAPPAAAPVSYTPRLALLGVG